MISGPSEIRRRERRPPWRLHVTRQSRAVSQTRETLSFKKKKTKRTRETNGEF